MPNKAKLHYQQNHRKMRVTYSIATLITLLLGLASRKWSYLLSPFLAENAGDILWAMMVFFGIRFILIHKSIITVLSLSLLFCFLIEFSQLYQANWMNHLRATTIGALILGKGFLIVDLIRYTIGILVVSIVDQIIQKQ